MAQLIRKGYHVSQVAFTPGGGQGIDTRRERNSWWRVPDSGRLGFVVIRREELLPQVVKARIGFLYESDPTIPSSLGQFLLRDGDQARVASVANGAVAELGVCRDWAKEDEGARNVGDLLRVVNADATTEEEVDDPCNGNVSALAMGALQLRWLLADVADATCSVPFSSMLDGVEPSRL